MTKFPSQNFLAYLNGNIQDLKKYNIWTFTKSEHYNYLKSICSIFRLSYFTFQMPAAFRNPAGVRAPNIPQYLDEQLRFQHQMNIEAQREQLLGRGFPITHPLVSGEIPLHPGETTEKISINKIMKAILTSLTYINYDGISKKVLLGCFIFSPKKYNLSY